MRKFLKVFVLVLFACLLLCGGIALWIAQPWLPYTEPEIQHALELHYGDRNPRLRGIWDSYGDCRVTILDIDGVNYGRVTAYATMEKINGVWEVISDIGSSGLVPMAPCKRP
jgi:hypothetical protein